MGEARSKAVFFFDEPNIDKLKACALFWKTIVVYEGFIQDLVHFPDFVDFTRETLEKGILKIVETPEGLKNSLHDKIYYGLDEDFWKFLHENSDSITVQPELPEDCEEIVKESSKMDNENKELRQLFDSIVYERIVRKWTNAASESDYFPIAPPEITKNVLKKMAKIAEIEYKNYRSRPENQRYHFEYRNRVLMEQLSVSSALCIDSDWAPLYRYKLGDFSIKNAKTYLDGLDVVVPLAARTAIQDFSLAEILQLRKNSCWNKAMDELAGLCQKARVGVNPEKFKERMMYEVIAKYQDALNQEKMTTKKLGKNLVKGAVYSGVSLVPVIGGALSTLGSKIADPLVSFLWKKKKQKNLPFFLNEMSSLKEAA